MRVLFYSFTDSDGGAGRSMTRIYQSIIIDKSINAKVSVDVKKTDIDGVSVYRKGFWGRMIIHLRSQPILLALRLLGLNLNDHIASLSLLPSFKMNRSDVDVFHLHWVCAESISIWDIALSKKPVIWTLHDLWPVQGIYHVPSSFNDGYILKTFDRLIKYFKESLWKNKINFVAPSRAVANFVESNKYSIQPKRIVIIPNPINTEFWRMIDNCKDYYNLNKKGRINILFGALDALLDENKNFKFLYKAYLSLRKYHPEIRLVVLSTTKKQRQIDLESSVVVINPLKDDARLRSVYLNSQILAMPSKFETFGQMAAEAACCGLPVIGFKGTGIEDIIYHMKTGYLAKNMNFEDFQNGIDWLLKEFKVQASFKESKLKNSHIISRAARRKFNYKRVGLMYSKFYKRVALEEI